jgi:hypothetical protein
MRPWHTIAPLAALLLAGPLAPRAAAQDPVADYNRMRAYNHFLASTAPVKSISATRPGGEWVYETPYASGRYLRSPAYYHEYVSPREHTIFVGPTWEEIEAVRTAPVVTTVVPVPPVTTVSPVQSVTPVAPVPPVTTVNPVQSVRPVPPATPGELLRNPTRMDRDMPYPGSGKPGTPLTPPPPDDPVRNPSRLDRDMPNPR